MMHSIRFDFSPTDIRELSEQEFSKLHKELDRIAIEKSQSALLDLESSLAYLSNNLGPIVFLKYVSPLPEIREVADEVETTLQKLMVDVFTREDLFNSLKNCASFFKSKGKTESELLDEYLFNFKRNGLDLSEKDRKSFIEKKKLLVEIESQFSQNLLKENTCLEFDRSELEGLPDSFIDNLEKSDSGKYRVTLSYPHVTPFMENVVHSESRKKLSFAFNNRGGEVNKNLLERAVSLRHELAQILGYSNHAELVLSRRMAQTPKAALAFLNDLVVKLKPIGKLEREKLIGLKKQILQDESALTSYEWRFLHNQLLKTQYAVDPLKIQEYFPLNKVLNGMFDIYQTLLGVEFIKVSNPKVWHPSVDCYEVRKDGRTVSVFYMDLFPREGKYSHAAAFTIHSGFRLPDGTYHQPVSSIVSNFSSPTQNRPSLLLHNEVETLFHEFGHIMHQVLTQATYPSFSGTGVKTDFVEAPSQMLENWVWNKEILKKISGHYLRPEESLPDSLIDKMLAAKDLNQGLHYLRQLAFGLIDLDIHTASQVDSTKIYSNRMQEILGIPILEGTQPQASFGHLMGGYDAGYYSYLWAEVFAQDMFSRFEREGLLNPQTGKEYREWILEPGGEKPPLDLVKGFLKREPNSHAFLKGLGVS